MDITGYRKKKGNGVEIRPIGNGVLHVYVAKFDPNTGEPLPEEFGQVNVANFENELKVAAAQVDRSTEFLEDLKAFIKDAEKADTDFGKAAKKPGASS
jgi:hypothetical protein